MAKLEKVLGRPPLALGKISLFSTSILDVIFLEATHP
jgi:hypothetical protein